MFEKWGQDVQQLMDDLKAAQQWRELLFEKKISLMREKECKKGGQIGLLLLYFSFL